MQCFQLTGEGISIRRREFGFAETTNCIQYIKRPSAFLGFDFAQRFDVFETRPHFARGQNDRFGDDGNTCVCGDAMQGDVAADPTRTPRGGGQWFAFDDGGSGKREARNQQQILDAPRGQLVLHEVEVRRLVRANRVHHRGIRAVRDGIADARLLAFKLIPELALGTAEVAGPRVVTEPAEFLGRTVWTIKVVLTPKLP